MHVLNPMSLHVDLYQCIVVDSQLPRWLYIYFHTVCGDLLIIIFDGCVNLTIIFVEIFSIVLSKVILFMFLLV